MDPPQLLTTNQGPDPESGNQEKLPQRTSTTLEEPESVTVTQRLKRFLCQRGNLSNILARAFLWIIQAGFLVLPTSFPSIAAIDLDSTVDPIVVQTNRNIEIFVLGIVSCVVGGIGLLCLGLCHSHNHAWHQNSIFIPGTLSGLSGLISTFVNIYGSDHVVYYGATTIITLVFTGGCTVICGSLTLNHIYRQRQLTHMDPLQPTKAHQSLTQGPDSEPGNREKLPQGTPTTTTLEDPESVTVARRLKRSLYRRGNLVRGFMWIVQAGFLVLPTSFPTVIRIIQSNNLLQIKVETNRNIAIFALGIVCCAVGGIGLLRLGLRHSHNHAWLLNSIFAPGTFIGLSGLISTFVNIYGSGHGVRYGRTTAVTIVITSGCAVICGSLTVRYYKKNSAIDHHERENAGGK